MNASRFGLTGGILFLVAVGMLSGCVTREPRPAGAWLEEREAWFEQHPDWHIKGRVSLSDGERAGSLGFRWEAEAQTHRIHLRTAAGGKQWRLAFSPGRAVLEGSDVGRLSGTHPDPLIREAIGWPIPMWALSWWIRGLLPPSGGDIRFAEDGTLAGVEGRVWSLDYNRFSTVQEHLLPTRLEARSEPYRVRIAIGEWQFGVEAD